MEKFDIIFVIFLGSCIFGYTIGLLCRYDSYIPVRCNCIHDIHCLVAEYKCICTKNEFCRAIHHKKIY